MRTFQVMRYGGGRRTTISNHESAQSMKKSSSFTSLLKLRNSQSLLSDEKSTDIQTSNGKRKLFGYR